MVGYNHSIFNGRLAISCSLSFGGGIGRRPRPGALGVCDAKVTGRSGGDFELQII